MQKVGTAFCTYGRGKAKSQSIASDFDQTLGALADHSEGVMGINNESDIGADLQIGPTDQGMVRIFVETDKVSLPLDFEPDEAEEIAEELRVAAAAARAK